jgi:hypothetical protein
MKWMTHFSLSVCARERGNTVSPLQTLAMTSLDIVIVPHLLEC